MDSKDTNSNASPMKPPEEIYLQQYLDTLNEKEKHAYEIARNHLGMSFQLDKSIGYLQWKTENITN